VAVAGRPASELHGLLELGDEVEIGPTIVGLIQDVEVFLGEANTGKTIGAVGAALAEVEIFGTDATLTAGAVGALVAPLAADAVGAVAALRTASAVGAAVATLTALTEHAAGAVAAILQLVALGIVGGALVAGLEGLKGPIEVAGVERGPAVGVHGFPSASQDAGRKSRRSESVAADVSEKGEHGVAGQSSSWSSAVTRALSRSRTPSPNSVKSVPSTKRERGSPSTGTSHRTPRLFSMRPSSAKVLEGS